MALSLITMNCKKKNRLSKNRDQFYLKIISLRLMMPQLKINQI